MRKISKCNWEIKIWNTNRSQINTLNRTKRLQYLWIQKPRRRIKFKKLSPRWTLRMDISHQMRMNRQRWDGNQLLFQQDRGMDMLLNIMWSLILSVLLSISMDLKISSLLNIRSSLLRNYSHRNRLTTCLKILKKILNFWRLNLERIHWTNVRSWRKILRIHLELVKFIRKMQINLDEIWKSTSTIPRWIWLSSQRNFGQ